MKKTITLHQYKTLVSAVAIALLLPACVISPHTESDVVAEAVETAGSTSEKSSHSSFFKKFDTDNDQKVSADEFTASGLDSFKNDDADSDGSLSRKEYMKASSKRMNDRKDKQRVERREKRFTAMDINNDGAVDKQEHMVSSQAHALKSFGNMDSNKNGEISAWEYNHYTHPKHSKSMGKKYSPYKRFKEMDSNEDGKLSTEERSISRLKWFESMDINGDKMVTQEEAAQARENRKKNSEKKM